MFDDRVIGKAGRPTGSRRKLYGRTRGQVNTFVSRPLITFAACLAVNVERCRGDATPPRKATVQDVGDLSVYRGLEEADARNYYVVVSGGELRVGAEVSLLFYRKDRSAGVDRVAPDSETRFPPEAVFRGGNRVRLGSLTVK